MSAVPKAIVGGLVLALTSGCFHITYTTHKTAETVPAYDQWHHNVVFGLAEVSDPVNVTQICPAGPAVVDNQVTFVNGLVQFLTISIYNPSTVTETCPVHQAGEENSETGIPVAATP